MIDRAYIDYAIQQAEAGKPPDLPIVPGLSSPKVRRLLNWLCKSPEANYLEIGTHMGSTLIPALWHNDHALASCIDIWAGTPDVGDTHHSDLDANLALHLPGRVVNVVEADMFTLDVGRLLPGVNVFFYDGPHTREGQYQAFAHYDLIFAPCFVALVDDWNWIEPREETWRAFTDLRYNVEAKWELKSRYTRDESEWWNGLFVAIVRKS